MTWRGADDNTCARSPEGSAPSAGQCVPRGAVSPRHRSSRPTYTPDIDYALAPGACGCKAGVSVQADYLELGLMFHENRVSIIKLIN